MRQIEIGEIECLIHKFIFSGDLSPEEDKRLTEILEIAYEDRSRLVPSSRTAYNFLNSLRITKDAVNPLTKEEVGKNVVANPDEDLGLIM